MTEPLLDDALLPTTSVAPTAVETPYLFVKRVGAIVVDGLYLAVLIYGVAWAFRRWVPYYFPHFWFLNEPLLYGIPFFYKFLSEGRYSTTLAKAQFRLIILQKETYQKITWRQAFQRNALLLLFPLCRLLSHLMWWLPSSEILHFLIYLLVHPLSTLFMGAYFCSLLGLCFTRPPRTLLDFWAKTVCAQKQNG